MLQFIYAVVGGGVCYGIYMSGLPKFIAIVLIIPIAIFVAALVFLKINERPFLDFFLSMLEFTSTPKNRLWRHENTSNMTVEIYKAKKEQKGPVVQSKKLTHEEIAALARRADQNTE